MGVVGLRATLRLVMTNEFTDFQNSLRSALEKIFMAKGKAVTWSLCGENEHFYYGQSTDSEIEVWLYVDEAECRLGDLQRICERPDFDSTDHLKEYFIEIVRARLS